MPSDISEKLRWLYLDLNSYFASVEQHLNPKLRGRPVAVVPSLTNSTSVIAASYPAKALGVKGGMNVGEAKKLCPSLVLIAGNHRHYVEYHKKIMEAVETCHPITMVSSIDEVAFRLGGRDQNLSNAVLLAKEMKEKILTMVGPSFTSSVGLSTNRFLAKVASDMQKPDGLVVVQQSDIPQKLYRLKPQDLIGIGPRMDIRLRKAGVYTVEKLYSLSIKQMRAIWGGVGGERYYQWLRGVDLELTYRLNQSVGHQHVLPPAMRTMTGVQQVGKKLLNKAAVRLRKLSAWTRHIAVSVRYMDGARWKNDLKMLECQDSFTLQEAFDQMWVTVHIGAPIKISVTLSDLVHESERNFSFFENGKRVQLSKTMDLINLRWGKDTVYLGSIAQSLDSAPTRIAFTSIPEMDVF